MRALLALLLLVGLAGCSSGHGAAAPLPSITPSPPTPSATPTRAVAAPSPPIGGCYALSYTAALAPSTVAADVRCRSAHTAQTFVVAPLDAVSGGHLLAVDSAAVQAQVAADCPGRLAAYVGGTVDQRRLSVLRAVWFTPTVAQADAGADWYRCDVIAVAADGALAPLPKHMKRVLDSTDGRDRFGVCGTAAPDAKGFTRVVCSSPHAWRAISVVDLPPGRYPGRAAAEAAGQAPCKAAGQDVADNALDYQWGYVWPTRHQWRTGQTYGLCWAPDTGG